MVEIIATAEMQRWESLKQTKIEQSRHASALQWRRYSLHIYFYVEILTL